MSRKHCINNKTSISILDYALNVKRALRVISNKPYNSHTYDQFKALVILKLQKLYEYQVAIVFL